MSLALNEFCGCWKNLGYPMKYNLIYSAFRLPPKSRRTDTWTTVEPDANGQRLFSLQASARIVRPRHGLLALALIILYHVI
jgi:hypothetical protein